MKTQSFKKLMLLGLTAGLAGLFSCGEDEAKTPLPVADFTFTLEGKTVTVVNASTDAETQTWDFGDGATSTDLNPSHTYEANGSYIVKLTVTNETGSDDKSEVLEVINIQIDGNLSDWDDVPALATYGDGEAGSFLEVKVENLEDDKLFIYVKTTSASNGFIDLFMNSDNDDATGFASWMYPTTPGFDILVEGYAISQSAVEAELFFGNYDDATAGEDKTAWAWTALTPSANFFKTIELQSSGANKAYEFSVDLSEFPPAAAASGSVKFFLIDVDAPDGAGSDWAWLGNAPAGYGEETSAAFTYTLK